jgi:hypothetical protein
LFMVWLPVIVRIDINRRADAVIKRVGNHYPSGSFG